MGRPYRTLFVVSPSTTLRTGLSYHERPFDRLRANVERTTLVDKRVWPCQNYNAQCYDWCFVKGGYTRWRSGTILRGDGVVTGIATAATIWKETVYEGVQY